VAEQALFYQMLLAQVHGHGSDSRLATSRTPTRPPSRLPSIRR
jgi:hypothetical protein